MNARELIRDRLDDTLGDFPQCTYRTSAHAPSPSRGRSRQRRLRLDRLGWGWGNHAAKRSVPSPSWLHPYLFTLWDSA